MCEFGFTISSHLTGFHAVSRVKHCDSRFTLCVLMFVRPFVPKRDGTAAIAVYLPVVQNIMPFHQATLKSPLYANILCSIQYEGVV